MSWVSVLRSLGTVHCSVVTKTEASMDGTFRGHTCTYAWSRPLLSLQQHSANSQFHRLTSALRQQPVPQAGAPDPPKRNSRLNCPELHGRHATKPGVHLLHTRPLATSASRERQLAPERSSSLRSLSSPIVIVASWPAAGAAVVCSFCRAFIPVSRALS